jgi:Lon protease-like protein
MERLLRGRRGGLAAQLLGDPSVSDDLLVNLLCYALDVMPLEKQALLEAPSLLDRARRLRDVLHFALEAKGAGRGPEEPQH